MDRILTFGSIPLAHRLGTTDYILSVAMRIGYLVPVLYFSFGYFKARASPLNRIPTIGYSGVLTSYLTAIQYMSKGSDLLQEGYDKFQGKPFKVATLGRWIVILTGRQYIQDLSGASDDIVSIAKPTIENTQADYTFGKEMLEDPYHITTLRSPLTRNLAMKFDDINDEAMHAMKENLDTSKDWVTVTAYETILHVLCRTSNRFLVGPTLCRDPHYQDLSERLSEEILDNSRIIGRFPRLLKPIAGKIFTKAKDTIMEFRQVLSPMIIERLEKYVEYGCGSDGDERTNDLLTWLIETSSQEYHRTIEDITRRVVMTNVASLHTSTMVLVQALYDLVVHPEYLEEMRHEVESVVAEYGWTRGALHKLSKLDSFVKESHRMNAISSFLMVRETLEDLILSDGTLISRGTHVGIASGAISMSEEYYQSANTFKGFRFAEMREGDGEFDPIKYQMVSLNPDTVMFGHGKHACPGRFFAVTLIKIIFAHILLEYDVQLENGSRERPPSHRIGIMSVPNHTAKLMFRKRNRA